jgi:hypothetical protein
MDRDEALEEIEIAYQKTKKEALEKLRTKKLKAEDEFKARYAHLGRAGRNT